ncbi:HipA domain-containing protein [Frankia sp. Cr2]|uniref:HipA domain-containing protein n=1 Tax=Frankia sp. Cr2 TaxID=3073932 RepID=UPI002AD470C2|nr:HipA domain-containing protein [Frankia sp. Cr2]
MADHLVAWLYETPTVVLTPGPEFRITLEWRAEAVERWGAGSPALSVGLPIGAVIGPRDMRGLDFFENVLPEGPTLQRMAAIAGVRPADTYGILKAFGRDCAGAIQVLPEGEEPCAGDEGGYRVMTSDDLRGVIGALDVAPLGVAPERGFRPSLAGFQRKALLGRAADGSWQLPTGDAPSTWILKPDGPHAMAANEATCLALAAACGLAAAEGELLDVAGLPVLAVRRFDRRECDSGRLPVRVHQEDGCQATATPPGMKYEEQGGPSLRDFAEVLRTFGDPRDVTVLLRRATFNTAVGNADAHAKNFAILHQADEPAVRLAPLYDVLSTIALELRDHFGQLLRADTHLGQRVGGQADIQAVTATNLVDEATTWGLRRRTAAAVVTDTLDQILASIPDTPGDDRVRTIIKQQTQRVRLGRNSPSA